MDAAFMSLIQHERGIHALRFGTNGARATKVRVHVRLLSYRSDKLIGSALEQHECGITPQALATVGTGVTRKYR
jgi:hypothetical protein